MSIINGGKIHFAHTADWHLGRQPYHHPALYQDFFRSANFCIEQIVQEQPQFVIHSGDLFQKANPEPGVRMEAHDLLQKLQEANIPLYIIRGNHDASPAYSERAYGTILDEFDKLGFFQYIKDEAIEIGKNIQFYGIGEYGKNFGVKLNEVLKDYPLDSSKINILAAHTFVKGQLQGDRGDISPYTLAEVGFDYVALGHFHTPWEDQDAHLYCPGSTEHQSISEWTHPDEDGFCSSRGFLDVKIDSEKQLEVNRLTFKVRPKVKLCVQLTSDLAKDAKTQIREMIKKYDRKNALLHLTIEGLLKAGELIKINFRSLEGTKQHCLVCKIVPDVTEPREIIKQGITEDEAILLILKKKYSFTEDEAIDFQPIVKKISTILSKKKKVTDDLEQEVLILLEKYINTQSEGEE